MSEILYALFCKMCNIHFNCYSFKLISFIFPFLNANNFLFTFYTLERQEGLVFLGGKAKKASAELKGGN